MRTRGPASVAIIFIVLTAACGPTLPPTTAPAQPDPTFDPFRDALQAYIDQTQPFRKQAAQAQESTPGKDTPTPASTQALRTRQNDLADALKTKVRANATQGQLFTEGTGNALRHQIAAAFDSPRRELLLDSSTTWPSS